MKETSEVTFCVLDHNLFLPLALRLAREAKRVLYWTPTEKGFPLINDGVIGRGFDEIERCDDFFPLLDEIDCFCCPDIQHAGLQLHLESIGKNVWGSRYGDSLELERVKFLNTLKEIGLPEVPFRSIIGLDELREYLKEHDDKFIKISRWRGTMETWHHVNYKTSEPMLDMLSVRFGAVKNAIPFVVCDPIETDIELGYDGFCIDGQFPETCALSGYEYKDKGYITSVVPYSDLPSEVTVVNDAMAPLLKDFRYKNFFSTEIRVKDGQSYYIDPCQRCPSPATEAQLELYENLGDIIWHGSQGELIEPITSAKFAVEAVMCMKADKTMWRTLEVPESIKQWVKIGSCCYIDGQYAIPPDGGGDDEIGWMLGIGDTIQEAIDHLKENVELLGDCRVHVNVESSHQCTRSQLSIMN